jgi:hypothetical protein
MAHPAPREYAVKDSAYKRCKCPPRYGTGGKRLACPKKHGSWSYVIDVPMTEPGRQTLDRLQVTRGGFATEDGAEAEKRLAMAFIEIPDADDDAGRVQIAQMIRDSYRRYRRLPVYD